MAVLLLGGAEDVDRWISRWVWLLCSGPNKRSHVGGLSGLLSLNSLINMLLVVLDLAVDEVPDVSVNDLLRLAYVLLKAWFGRDPVVRLHKVQPLRLEGVCHEASLSDDTMGHVDLRFP